MSINTLKNLSKSKKIIVFLSIIWTVLGFILSVFISSDSSSGSFLVFLASLALLTLPVWIYWTGFWIWGDGYIIKFFNLIIINPFRNLVGISSSFIRNISIFGWICIVCFTSSVSVSVYLLNALHKINSLQIGILIGQYFIPLLICIASISKKRPALLQKALIFCLLLLLLFVVLRLDYRNYLDSNMAAKSKLEADILATNQSLPIMIDEDTRLDNLSIQDEDISYNYTLINVSVENLDVSKLELAIISDIKIGACSIKETRALLDANRNIKYTYRDKAEKPILTITVNKKDCL